MNHPKKIRTIIAAVSVVLTLGVTVLAASYDSSEDPLISLSYLTNIFKPEIREEYEDRIAELEARLSALENQTPTIPEYSEPVVDTTPETEAETEEPVIDTTPEVEYTHSSTTYEVVELTYGDALYAVTACDIMLRSGKAACIAPDASQGIADYTDGYEVFNDQAIVKNHMLLIPRGDGRGIKAISESVFVMVWGDYTIVEG